MKKWVDKYQSVISLILFAAAVIGWIVDSQVNQKVTEIKVEANSENIEWIVQTMLEDKELKGKIIMYIQMEEGIDVE